MEVRYTQCDFLAHDLLHPFKDNMVESYFKYLKDNQYNYASPYTNNVIKNSIIPELLKCVNASFNIKVTDVESYIYVQNNEYCRPNFHHHMNCEPNHLNAPLTAALYLDPPEVGGEFQFLPRLIDSETYEQDLKRLTYKVERDKLYFFPPWAMHRPLPQEDETYRVCLTFNIYSFDRPEFIPAKVIW